MTSTQTFQVAPCAGAEERFTLLLDGNGFKTIPQSDDQGRPLPHPLLARLHGHEQYDCENPPNVTDIIDVHDVLPPDRIEPRDRWLEALKSYIFDLGPSNAVVLDVVESGSDSMVFRVRDAREVEMEGGIDLSECAKEMGLPMQAMLLRSGSIVLIRFAPDGVLARLDDGENAADDSFRVSAALRRLAAAFPDPDNTYFSLTDFLDKQSDETPWEVGRSLYKYTECGPSLTFLVPGLAPFGVVGYSDPKAREESASWWKDCVGLSIGSIVEGSDAEVQSANLTWPVTQAQFDAAVEWVNEEACRLWDEANGVTPDEDEDAHDAQG